jgi:ubiquinone/menaquinone biosynthesis C-methylase UbiE
MPTAGSTRHPLFARFFDRFAVRDEERGQAELRRELLAGMAGRVVEVGAGNGLNFPHYPASVRLLVAVEPEPYLRWRAAQAARVAPIPIRVVAGTADHLPVADESVDAVVVSGVLCSVPDPRTALTEFRRVLRPGGELRFYEHVRSGSRPRGWYQDAANLLWPRFMGGCHPNRDTRAAIEQAGYRVAACRGLLFPPGSRLLPVAPRILGRATPGQREFQASRLSLSEAQEWSPVGSTSALSRALFGRRRARSRRGCARPPRGGRRGR